jgi:putative flippase GtrA
MIRRLLDDRRVRYVLAGGLAAAVYYLTFTAAWLVLPRQVPYLSLAVLTNFITAVVMYPIQRRLVFRVDGPWLPGFLRFYVLCLGALLIVLVGLPLLVEVAGLHVLLAQAIVIGGSPLINYQVSRLWAFRRRPVETGAS